MKRSDLQFTDLPSSGAINKKCCFTLAVIVVVIAGMYNMSIPVIRPTHFSASAGGPRGRNVLPQRNAQEGAERNAYSSEGDRQQGQLLCPLQMEGNGASQIQQPKEALPHKL